MDSKDFIIEQYARQIADLTALVNTLTDSNAALNETIKELQRQLNQKLTAHPIKDMSHLIPVWFLNWQDEIIALPVIRMW